MHAWLALPRTTDTIQGVDGAEFAMAAVRGSLVHPPGYPLVTTLMHGLWRLTGPWDNPMAVLAQFCALQNALACALWTAVLWLARPTGWWAPALGLCMALQPSLLHTSTDVDVFASLHVVGAVVAWLLLRGHLAWAVVMTGVAGAVHPMAIAMTPLLAVALWQRGRWRHLLFGGGVAVAVSLSCYGLLWVRYQAAPSLAFLPIESISDWLGYVMRRHYGTLKSGNNDDTFVSGITHAMRSMVMVAPMMIVGVIAAVGQARRQWLTLSPWLVMVALHLLLWWQFRVPSHAGGEPVMMRFLPQGLWCAAVVAAMSLPTISHRGWMMVAVVAPALLALPATLARVDARHDRALDAYIRRVMSDAPPDAQLWVAGDGTTFGAHYLQAALGVRPDLTIVSPRQRHKDLARAWVATSETTPPPNVRRQPSGIGFRFYHDGEAVPTRDDTMTAILRACTTLPAEAMESLQAGDDRPEAGLAASLWLNPLEGLAASTHPLAGVAQAALAVVQQGDLEGARARCRAATE
jgi:hypothetical protein